MRPDNCLRRYISSDCNAWVRTTRLLTNVYVDAYHYYTMLHPSEKQDRHLTSFLIRDILRQEDAEENESVVVDSDGEQHSPLSAGTNSDTEDSLLKESDGKETGLYELIVTSY